MKHIAVTRNTHTSLGVLLEKNIEDYWNVDGETELSDAWTGFTQGRGGDLRGNKQPLVQTMYGQICGAKQKWVIEKPKLDDARQLRDIFLIEPDDEEFKHTMKNARRKLEVPMPAAMPCETPVNCRNL